MPEYLKVKLLNAERHPPTIRGPASIGAKYVFAGHFSQLSVPLYVPALHEQAVATVLPDGESALNAHSIQAPFPVTALYFPATHAVHMPPSGPVKPALQVQAVDTVLAAGDPALSGHDVHTLVPSPLKLSLAQSRHDEASTYTSADWTVPLETSGTGAPPQAQIRLTPLFFAAHCVMPLAPMQACACQKGAATRNELPGNVPGGSIVLQCNPTYW